MNKTAEAPKKKMGRPKGKPSQQLTIALPEAMVETIDKLRLSLIHQPDRASFIRELAADGLNARIKKEKGEGSEAA